MTLSDPQLETYRDFGHLTVPGVFTPGEMDAAIADAQAWADDVLAGLSAEERAYEEIRSAELELRLLDLPPIEAMRRLISFTFTYFIEAPHFITLLNSENLHKARHLRRSKRIRHMHSTLVALLAKLLDRGAADGVFRRGVDPVQLFITITGVGYFYFSNIHTLSTIFGRDFTAADEIATRHDHVIEVVLGYLRP